MSLPWITYASVGAAFVTVVRPIRSIEYRTPADDGVTAVVA